jgi:polyphosphate kinase
MKKQSPYINRELSWLGFNARVLEEARDAANPLLERFKFLSIFRSNLDEFFMVRAGALLGQCFASLPGGDSITNMTPEKQLEAIFAETSRLTDAYNGVSLALFCELEQSGITYLNAGRLSGRNTGQLHDEFLRCVMPLLSAIIVDAKHPFPYLPNKSVFIAVRIKGKNREKLGLILFPEPAEKLVFLRDTGLRFFLAEDAALAYAGEMFPKQELLEAGKFRVTRSADILPDEDPDGESFKAAMQRILEVRKRLAPVRLETDLPVKEELVLQLCQRLGLDSEQAFSLSGPLDMRFAYNL